MRIVIVEDNAVILDVITMALQAVPGYEVIPLTMAEDGLHACQDAVDLAIFDNQLPDLTGIEAIARLRALPATRHLPAIVITGDSDRQTRLAAIRAGANDFLEKPLQIEELRMRVRNLLALHKAQKDAAAGQTLLETLIAAAGANVAIGDARRPGAPILYTSEPFRARLGMTADALQRMRLADLWEDGAPSETVAKLKQAIGTCNAGSFTLADPLGDGAAWAEVSLRPVAEADGSVRHIVATVSDVTDLVKTRQAHAVAESRLSDIARVSGAWFFELDSRLRFRYASDAMAGGLGATPQQLIGMPIGDLQLQFADPLQHDTGVESLFAAPHPALQGVMIKTRTSDGGQRILQINATPFFDGSGTFGGYRGHASDVTEITATRDQAAQASKAKSIFLATISHEMRTPLTAIIGLSEVANGDLDMAALHADLAEIRTQALRLSGVLSDVIDVADMEEGKITLDAAPFDPVKALEQSVTPYAQEAQTRELGFEQEISGPRDGLRRGDSARFAAIIRALVSNAIKFTAQGQVSVGLDLSDPARVICTVSDTGIGMTRAEQERALLPFVQIDDGIARRYQGAGLGLSIVKWLTEAMQGDFQITSTPGMGTQIRVSLPLPVAPTRAATARDTRAKSPLSGSHVLVADDNMTNLRILQVMLRKMGARVTLSYDGPEALSAWHQTPFDLVLLDINMPAMAGTEVIRRIRSQEAIHRALRVPALAVTANARPDQVSEYRAAGFDDCLSKPFTASDLATKILALKPTNRDAGTENLPLGATSD